MSAPIGNDHNSYSIDELKSMIKNYAEHLSLGYSKICFPDCDYRTIDSAFEKYALELQTEKREVEKAIRKGRMGWEEIGKTIANGKIQGNAVSWIFNMKNRYKDEWKDRQETESNISFNEVIMPKPPSEASNES